MSHILYFDTGSVAYFNISVVHYILSKSYRLVQSISIKSDNSEWEVGKLNKNYKMS